MATKKKTAKQTTSSAGSTSDFYGMLDKIFVGMAPIQLPKPLKEWIVKYGPWVILLVLGIFLPVILGALGISAIILPFSTSISPKISAGLSVQLIFYIVELGLLIAALPGLFARKMQGWKLVLFAVLANFVIDLFDLHVINALVTVIVGLYVAFQVRSYYKD